MSVGWCEPSGRCYSKDCRIEPSRRCTPAVTSRHTACSRAVYAMYIPTLSLSTDLRSLTAAFHSDRIVHMFAAFILTSICIAPAAAALNVATAIASGPWSSADTWSNRQLPSTFDAVWIRGGLKVVVDANVTVQALTVSGAGSVLTCMHNAELSPVSKIITLDLERLVVEHRACFSCGAGDCHARAEPYAGHMSIRLRSKRAPTDTDQDVRTVLVRDGGILHLNGRAYAGAITRLVQHAWAGNVSIVVGNAQIAGPYPSSSSSSSSWPIGGRIALAPTDYDPGQTEYHKIVDVSRHAQDDGAAVITLDSRLAYSHNGQKITFTSPTNPFIVDTRAEVALLSRNIVIEGVRGDAGGFGGDVKITGENTRVSIEWCEFRLLGRRGHLGRYPLHLHDVGGSPYIANVAVHESYQRGIVLHCTNNARVVDSVVAGVYGFAFMLEDGAEEDNVLSGNLAMDINNALPNPNNSVFTEHANPAAFWFLNPSNSFIGNTAAGARGVGFSWEMIANRTASYTLCPQRVPGYDVTLFAAKRYGDLDRSVYGAMMRRNIAAFRNNSAHSMLTGLWFHGGADAKVHYPSMQSVIDNFVAWKLRPRDGMTVGLFGANHDGCIHVSDLTQLKFVRVACVNSPNAFWSMQSNVVDIALMAWVDESGSNPQLIQGTPPPTSPPNRETGQAWVVYSEPQTFLNIHVSGIRMPVFQAKGDGSLASSHTIIGGFSTDTADLQAVPDSQIQLAMTKSRAPHIFTDVDGTVLGMGAGARVVSSCAGCNSLLDPIIDAYAPNACTPFVGKVVKDEYTSPQLAKGVIKGVGAAPLVCAGQYTPPMSIVRITSRGDHVADSQIHVFTAFGTPRPQYLRSLNITGEGTAWFVVPMTTASTSPLGGYRLVSSTGWRGMKTIMLEIGPTTMPSQGVIMVFSWFPSQFDVVAGTNIEGLPFQLVRLEENLSTAEECAGRVATDCDGKLANGTVCVCRSSQGDLFLRLSSSLACIPHMYDSAGRNYLHQGPSVRLVWNRKTQQDAEFGALAMAMKRSTGDRV